MAYSGLPLYFRENKELSGKSALLNSLESVFQQTLGTKARILAPTPARTESRYKTSFSAVVHSFY